MVGGCKREMYFLFCLLIKVFFIEILDKYNELGKLVISCRIENFIFLVIYFLNVKRYVNGWVNF